MSQKFPGFPQEARIFLRDLKSNNNRDWFLARKSIYETKVKKPMVDFVLALHSEMRTIAKEFVFDPARSIFRIYRDIRFSQDKSPYKTHIAAAFDPQDMRKRPSAGLYFHLAADELFLGGGIYMPGSAELVAIRNAIAENPNNLRKIIGSNEFKKMFKSLKGEQLSRVPRGFAADDPAADLLRHKQYLAFVTLSPDSAEKPQIVNQTVKYFRGMLPLIRYLNSAIKKQPRRLRA